MAAIREARVEDRCYFLFVPPEGRGEGLDACDKASYKTGALKYALLQSFLVATGDDPEDERLDSKVVLGRSA
jgi:hypothetical protein